ncbi:hypothetical protein AYK20_05660 [Thermoplasmatales archaeon SG8-52-1]|nr:MAG: hypothetical protein AYK20_05660 [Thermoplasmatales archaeon SG8-52-1]
MAFGLDIGINNLLGRFSIEKILSGDLSLFTWLFSIMIMIAIYSIIIYHFYRYIARRDCFKPSERKHGKAVGILKYMFVFPVIAMLFFIGFSLILIFLTNTIDISQILYTAFVLVLAIRITAYYTEDLSKDVAKMLPFAILGIFLVDSSYFSIESVGDRINLLPDFINLIIQFLLLIIFTEWILRAILSIRNYIFPKKEGDSC